MKKSLTNIILATAILTIGCKEQKPAIETHSPIKQELYIPKPQSQEPQTHANISLENITNHIISATIEYPFNYDSLSMDILDNDQGDCLIASYSPPPSNQPYQQITSPIFKFLPENTTIQINGHNQQQTTLLADTTYSNQIIKSIIIDRNGEEERLYQIEGDSFNLFGRIVDILPVSTGLVYGDRNTPLGYHHIRSKREMSVNYDRGWYMPWALWYFEQGVLPPNGIHQGEEGTPYGQPASHGCTRVPDKFAEGLYNWAEIGTPVIIIDDQVTANIYKNDFDRSHYNTYMQILQQLNNPYFENNKLETLQNLNPYFNSILDACEQWKQPQLPNFNELTEELLE